MANTFAAIPLDQVSLLGVFSMEADDPKRSRPAGDSDAKMVRGFEAE